MNLKKYIKLFFIFPEDWKWDKDLSNRMLDKNKVATFESQLKKENF